MTSGRSFSINKRPLYIPPQNFADYLYDHQEYCLFLDIDGTLAGFTLNPKDSTIPAPTLKTLQKIQIHGVKIAAVTGRSMEEAKQMLSPIRLPIAATHGLEIAGHSDINDNEISTASVNTIELNSIIQSISQSCEFFDDFTIENKPYSVALHFRQNPTLADMAHTIMLETAKKHPNWVLKPGKFVWEMTPRGVNKGLAILTLLKKMQIKEDVCPIFIGDDITDEAGFLVLQNGDPQPEKSKLLETCGFEKIKGMGVKVGSGPSHANYYVNNIEEVTILLNSFLRFCQKNTLASD